MKNTYTITGMTCQNCKKQVEENLQKFDAITNLNVSLEKEKVTITSKKEIDTKTLQDALPNKYKLLEEIIETKNNQKESKLKALKPLFIILAYITVFSNLRHLNAWNLKEVMLDFMGLFFIVFSFFKLLDLKGFTVSFAMYDPIAQKSKLYGWLYPFIETGLGLMLLFRFEVKIALVATLIVLGITTIGVSKSLLSNKKIRCACLGTALNLPMTEATFIENAIMILMSIALLLN